MFYPTAGICPHFLHRNIKVCQKCRIAADVLRQFPNGCFYCSNCKPDININLSEIIMKLDTRISKLELKINKDKRKITGKVIK